MDDQWLVEIDRETDLVPERDELGFGRGEVSVKVEPAFTDSHRIDRKALDLRSLLVPALGFVRMKPHGRKHPIGEAASEPAASPPSAQLEMRVPRGRPRSSSSACAATPSARANAASVQPSRLQSTTGARQAPIAT